MEMKQLFTGLLGKYRDFEKHFVMFYQDYQNLGKILIKVEGMGKIVQHHVITM